MSDSNDAPNSGEPNEQSWGHGSWSPPPPPPDWRDPGPGWREPGPAWHDPGAGWRDQGGSWQDPRYGGWGAPGPGGQGGHGGPGGPPPGYPYWGSPYPGGWGPGGPAGPGGHRGWGYGWSQPRPRRSLPHAVTALLLVVAVLVGLGIGHGVWRSVHNSVGANAGSGGNNFGLNPFGFGNGNSGSNGANGSNGSNGSGIPSGALSGAAATVSNELVDINTSLSYQNGQAAGTGIVLTSDGIILTNNHVISGATQIKATDIGNGQTYTAHVIGYDRVHDVAIIKLQNASGLKTADIGDSSKVSVGDAVVGLGNAGGVGGSPSRAAGQVVALNQAITAQDESNGTSEKLTGLIETNANIQPGDSGGALINSAGKVIGMDTAASTGFSFQTQGNQGFAIPINNAMSIAKQIRDGRASNTIHIGATAFLGVEVDTSAAAANTQGAVISGTIASGPAAAAGLAKGDVITGLGGSPVDSANGLTGLISHYHPGDKVQVQWTDPTGATHTATVTLARGPAA